MPAIHLSRQEVAELFTQVTGETQAPGIGNLVKVARKELREAFLTADMGISGANFAIAATTTLPRVHVALVGVDKLVPDLHSALRILKILPPGPPARWAKKVPSSVGPSCIAWACAPSSRCSPCSRPTGSSSCCRKHDIVQEGAQDFFASALTPSPRPPLPILYKRSGQELAVEDTPI